MTTSVPVRDVSEAKPCTTANVTSSPSGRFITSRNEGACELVPVLASAEHGCAVGTKLYTFRWILNQIKIDMGYRSSKINYLGVRYPFPLQYNCGAMDCTSLLKRKVLGSIPSELGFSSIFLYFLNFYNNHFFPNFVGNIITYLK